MKYFAIPVLIAAFVFNIIAAARDANPKDEVSGVRLKPLKIEKEDSEIRKLQKERFNKSIDVVQGLLALFDSGTVPVPFLLESQERMVAAGLEIEIDQKSRVAILEEGVRLAKMTEDLLKSEVDAGKARSWQAHYAGYVRADFQLRLLKEKSSRRQ